MTRPSLKLRSITTVITAAEAIIEAKTEDEAPGVSKTFIKIWRDFYGKRGGSKPVTRRAIPLPKLLGFIQELYEVKSHWDMLDDLTVLPQTMLVLA